ncbi:MAG: DUF262 domain-containing protein [Chloroflexi bacterium]|nr:DUF262 domain-containing protein [Chloroflexota bacterium]MYI03323.1 DUF262 domain-containing protein [Chloroflexota bacterium]
MAFQTPITLRTALDKIQAREYVLPAIQRGFVWDTDQIAALFDSLMKGYPINSLLFWNVTAEHSEKYVWYDFIRDYHQRKAPRSLPLPPSSTPYTAILDGQQRLTALNIGLRGSHAAKLPRRRKNNPAAYPIKYLYLNLLQPAGENDFDVEYDFRFLSETEAKRLNESPDAHWFKVRTVNGLDDAVAIFNHVHRLGLADHGRAFPTLVRLHQVTQLDPIINFFEENDQDLDRVLNIFIRVNSGGTVLSYSDLLLSIATAQWTERDARETVQSLVEDLNDVGHGFSFSKDIVLKAGLMLTDISSIEFRVTNFTRENMLTLEAAWDSIETSLRLAAQLLADFGFSERTLRANSVILPIAYYLHRRSLTESFRSGPSFRADREKVRLWTVRSLVKSGIWGSGLDTLLAALRATIREHGSDGFPADRLERAMAARGKSLQFDEEEIDALADLEYGSASVFSLLALLSPNIDLRHEFHVDHIFPRKLLSTKGLAKQGLSSEQIEEFRDRMNGLGNLQFLEGTQNAQKSGLLPMDWAKSQWPDTTARDAWLAGHDMVDLPEELQGFIDFFDARRDRLRAKIREVLVS